ncbi:hypothetical protein BN85405610 [Alteracholeplasma palmae J233]|uniref:Right handed beta helix domain-containing protein n=1 Tax=Alteracholeplasma palmae (strain ATCC 49389 / J233) TaxID=1318466 RepID=U4KKK9_ALTPJ|nr:InlB B-repeat-containing protein [Alteracholeplasma palmae]CCV64138.1 hypothetical protein BN85405610 [Alteracholeplasma palmae J233]
MKGLIKISSFFVGVLAIAGIVFWIISSQNKTKEYTVRFESEKVLVESKKVKKGEKLEEPTKPNRTGYDFDGWWKEPTYISEWKFTIDTVESDITLYAKWEPTVNETVTITFNTDGAPEIAPLIIDKGTKAELPTPKKEGYTFTGWHIGNVRFDSTKPVDNNITLTAKWEVITPETKSYKVVFNYDNNTPNLEVEILENGIITKPANPTKEGYVFSAWYVDNTEYNFNSPVTKDITVTARWIKEHTVTFTVDGTTYNTVKVTDNNKVLVPTNNPVKEGFIFKEWHNSNGELFNFESTITEDTEIVAYFEEKEANANYYTVTFNSNSGQSVASQELKEDQLVKEPGKLTKEGYNFLGWFLGETKYSFDTPIKSNLELVAKWEIHTFKVAIDYDYDGLTENKTVDWNTKIQLDNPTRESHDFVEWQLDGQTFDKETLITKDIALKAIWKIKTYEVTINPNNGSDVTTQTINWGERPQLLGKEDLSKEGYVFYAWYAGSIRDNENLLVKQNLEFKLKWAKAAATAEGLKDALTKIEADVPILITAPITLTEPLQLPAGALLDGGGQTISFAPIQEPVRFRSNAMLLNAVRMNTKTGLVIENSDSQLVHTKIAGATGFGITVKNAENVLIEDVEILDSEQGAILITGSTVTIKDVTMTNNFKNIIVEEGNKNPRVTTQGSLITNNTQALIIIEQEVENIENWFDTNLVAIRMENETRVQLVEELNETLGQAYTFRNGINTIVKDYKTLIDNVTIDNITLLDDINLTEQIIIRRALTLDGNNKTVTLDNRSGWDAQYLIQVYNATDVVIKNIRLQGGDAGLLVNASEVKVENITLDNHEFGGIEVSKGEKPTHTPALEVNGLTHTNINETLPIIWIDNLSTIGDYSVIVDGLKEYKHPKKDQQWYVLESYDTEAPELETNTIVNQDGKIIITIKANDENLHSLEIDHNFEGILPEFTVYASESNPYGTDALRNEFEKQGVEVVFESGKWTIIIDGSSYEKLIKNANSEFIVHFVIADKNGNKFGSMSPTTNENTIKVSLSEVGVETEEELRLAITNPNITAINLVNDIELKTSLVVTRPVVINGNGNVLSLPTNTEWVKGSYVIQAFKTTGVVIKNITLAGGNAGLLVNGSEVTVENVKVTNNSFGGIEVSKGKNVESTPILTVNGLTYVTTNNLPVIWVDQVSTIDEYEVNVEELSSYKPVGKDQVWYVEASRVPMTVKENIEAALDYKYEGYQYTGTFKLNGTEILATYAGIVESKSVMNDLARYLGALYRVDGSIVKEITFNGIKYTWNNEGKLSGSNWMNGETTLVSAVTTQFLVNPTQLSYDFILSDGENTETLTLTIDEATRVSVEVKDELGLRIALGNFRVAEIILTKGFELSQSLVVTRPVVINGNGNVLSLPTNTEWVKGSYVIQAFKTTGVVIKNITLAGGNAGLLVNGSEVTVENVEVTNNSFGGIEVSKGKNVTSTPKLTVNGLTYETTNNLPVIWVDKVSSIGAYEVITNLESYEPNGKDQVWFVSEGKGALNLEDTIEAAYGYKYEKYTYNGKLNKETLEVTYTLNMDEKYYVLMMNDFARYMGALYRVERSSVKGIIYDGVTYTWNESRGLKGSNWMNGDKTLVEVLVAKYKENPTKEITVSLIGKETKEITFKLDIVANVSDETGLRLAVKNPGVREIILTKGFELKASLVLERPIVINGNGNTLSRPIRTDWVERNYVIQAYNTTGVVIKNITLAGGNAGLLVNGSEVTVENVKVTNNSFGGIEVSKGENVTSTPKLTVNGLTYVTTNNLPVIWVDKLAKGEYEVRVDGLKEYNHPTKNQVWYVVENYDTEAPELETKTMVNENGTIVITIKANDENLHSLEIDHNFEKLGLPEFTVYASESNPYGTDALRNQFESYGVTVIFKDGQWTITLDGAAYKTLITKEPKEFVVYFVIADKNGNKFGSMSPTTNENTIRVSLSEVGVENEEELRLAITNTKVKVINILNDIKLETSLVLERPVVINGNENTLSLPINTKWVERNYVIQAYNTTGVVIKNITLAGGNAGLLVNGSEVTVENVEVTNNSFGGIEVSKGKNVTSTPKLTVNGLTYVTTNNLPVIWVDKVSSIDEYEVNAEELSSYKPVGKDQVWYVEASRVPMTVEENIQKAFEYKYADYTYKLTTALVGDAYVINSSRLVESKFLMNDLARYLGALYRVDGSVVREITFNGIKYTWNNEGELSGSNWMNGETTLVSAVTTQFLVNPNQLSYAFNLSDGENTKELVFMISKEIQLSADVSSESELRIAVANPAVKAINLTNGFNLTETSTTVKSGLVISRPLTLNGNGHTLTMDNKTEWQGNYIIQVIKTEGVILNNIKFDGGDAAILVNGAVVEVKDIVLGNHEFGGIEVSTGKTSGLLTPRLTVNGLITSKLAPTLSAVWTEGTHSEWVTYLGSEQTIFIKPNGEKQTWFGPKAYMFETVNVTTQEELRSALEKPEVKVINLVNNIELSEGFYQKTKAGLLINRAVTINGNGKELSMISDDGWQANYILHIYNASGVILENIKFNGGDAAILLNGSETELKNITLGSYEFGGIEVKNLANKVSELSMNQVSYGSKELPVVWFDGITTEIVFEGLTKIQLVAANGKDQVWFVSNDFVQTTAYVRNEVELRSSVLNKNIKTIILVKDIELTNAIEINQRNDLVLNGSGKTLILPEITEFKSFYLIKLYLSEVEIKNIKLFGGDAGILVNGSKATVENIEFLNHRLAGIDLSKGKGVTINPSLQIKGALKHNLTIQPVILVDDASINYHLEADLEAYGLKQNILGLKIFYVSETISEEIINYLIVAQAYKYDDYEYLGKFKTGYNKAILEIKEELVRDAYKDLARLLGALYRVSKEKITKIVFNNLEYTWNEKLDRKGSNFELNGVSLVSVLSNYILNDEGQKAQITIHTMDASLDINIQMSVVK